MANSLCTGSCHRFGVCSNHKYSAATSSVSVLLQMLQIWCLIYTTSVLHATAGLPDCQSHTRAATPRMAGQHGAGLLPNLFDHRLYSLCFDSFLDHRSYSLRAIQSMPRSIWQGYRASVKCYTCSTNRLKSTNYYTVRGRRYMQSGEQVEEYQRSYIHVDRIRLQGNLEMNTTQKLFTV